MVDHRDGDPSALGWSTGRLPVEREGSDDVKDFGSSGN